MAIINSMGVGRARKSMGNVTYRNVRGRTLGSQKIQPRPITRGDALSRYQAAFGLINMFMRSHASDIDVSFNKTRFGSARNNFFKTNRVALEEALSALIAWTVTNNAFPSADEIESAVTAYATENPAKIVRVKLAGFDTVYMDGAWSSDDNPISGGGVQIIGRGTASLSGALNTYSAPCASSLTFIPGAKIVREAGEVTITCKGIPGGVAANSIAFITNGGAVVDGLLASKVSTSNVGEITYTSPEITADSNIIAVRVGVIYVHLTSAYVKDAQ